MATTFVSFSFLHAATVAVCAAAMVVSCRMGLARGGGAERLLRRRWGWFVAGFALLSNAWWLWPSNFALEESLPLHLCDLAVIVAAVAMLADARWARALLYFWGIGLSTQAFVTPTVEEGVATVKFWLFWVGHTAIVGSAVYDVVVRRFRPTRRDLLLTIAVTGAYGAAMAALDASVGLNYGYVGAVEPERPTIIQRLGPWPGRLAVIAAIVLADYLVLWGVWSLPRAARRARRA